MEQHLVLMVNVARKRQHVPISTAAKASFVHAMHHVVPRHATSRSAVQLRQHVPLSSAQEVPKRRAREDAILLSARRRPAAPLMMTTTTIVAARMTRLLPVSRLWVDLH